MQLPYPWLRGTREHDVFGFEVGVDNPAVPAEAIVKLKCALRKAIVLYTYKMCACLLVCTLEIQPELRTAWM